MEELTKQQKRLAEAVRYRGNVPDYFRRKKPIHQVGKNEALATERKSLPHENMALDDPALDLMRRGLITIRNVKPRYTDRQPMNSPVRGIDGDILRDLEHIHLNIIEDAGLVSKEDRDIYDATLKSREILEAADDQLRRLRRVRLEDQKAKARRRLQQLRHDAHLRGAPVGSGAADAIARDPVSRVSNEFRVRGRVFESGGGAGGGSRVYYESGDPVDDVYFINETEFAEDALYLEGDGYSEYSARSPEARGSRIDGANLRYTHDSRHDLPSDDIVERLLASRSPSASFFAALADQRDTSWCACKSKSTKDICGVCNEVGRHAAWCQHATSRRCEACGKYHRRGSLSREPTRVSSERTPMSRSSEETIVGPNGTIVRKRRTRHSRRRRGGVEPDSEDEDEAAGNENLDRIRRRVRQGGGEMVTGGGNYDGQWSGDESIYSGDEVLEIDPETGYPRKPRLKTRRRRPQLKQGQKYETSSAVYRGVRLPRKEQYRTAHLQAIAANRSKQMTRAMGRGYPADYIFGLRTSRPTFSYYSLLPRYSRGLDLFNVDESMISKLPRFVDISTGPINPKGRRKKEKKLTPMKLTYGDENPDNFIPRPVVLTVRKPKLSESFYKSFKGI